MLRGRYCDTFNSIVSSSVLRLRLRMLRKSRFFFKYPISPITVASTKSPKLRVNRAFLSFLKRGVAYHFVNHFVDIYTVKTFSLSRFETLFPVLSCRLRVYQELIFRKVEEISFCNFFHSSNLAGETKIPASEFQILYSCFSWRFFFRLARNSDVHLDLTSKEEKKNSSSL